MKKNVKKIEIEISSDCNLHCPNCNMKNRLHIAKSQKKICCNIEDKIIKYIPYGSKLLFLGLGEPTIPLSQLKILKILTKRKDCTGFIQTNGSFPIIDKLIPFIKSKKLEIALSYDSHHSNGGQKIKIQKSLVKTMSICISNSRDINSNNFINSLKKFKNLNKILLDPLISKEGNKILTKFQEIELSFLNLKKEFPQITFYMQLFEHWKTKDITFKNYYRNCIKDKIKIKNNWYYSIKNDYLINIENQTINGIRILTNGKILTNLTLIELSWNRLEKEANLIDIEKFDF